MAWTRGTGRKSDICPPVPAGKSPASTPTRIPGADTQSTSAPEDPPNGTQFVMLVHMFQLQSVHGWLAFYAALGTTLFRELSCPFVKLTQSEAEARPSL